MRGISEEILFCPDIKVWERILGERSAQYRNLKLHTRIFEFQFSRLHLDYSIPTESVNPYLMVSSFWPVSFFSPFYCVFFDLPILYPYFLSFITIVTF